MHFLLDGEEVSTIECHAYNDTDRGLSSNSQRVDHNFKEQNFIEMKGREITAVFPDPLRKVLTGTSVQNS